MDLKVFPRHELLAVLGALRNVALANDRFTDAERDLVEGVARIHDLDIDADALEPMSFQQIARIVTEPHRRKRAVQLAIVTALVEGQLTEETERSVSQLANALGVSDEGLGVLYETSRGRALLARFDMMRRVGRFMRGIHDFPGLMGFALPFLGIAGADEALADRYRALGNCAPGTLGRATYDHFTSNGFEFPGELGGFPAAGIFHDLGHVVAGYATDPQGEIQQAAFQAGFARNDGFSFLLFGILQFHMGMRITPVAKGYRGLFDVPLVLEALRRGAACKVDFSQGYDLFGRKDRLLEEVRVELGVPPLQLTVR